MVESCLPFLATAPGDQSIARIAKVENTVAHTDTAWTRLAARTARGILARKGMSYQEVAEILERMGTPETPRGAESKIQRGSYRFAFFLQVLQAVDAEYPPQWRQFLESGEAWESVAAHVFLHELSTSGIDYRKLSRRLARVGIEVEPSELESQIVGGAFQFTLFLQLALVAPISGLERFVDHRDVERTASESGDAPHL